MRVGAVCTLRARAKLRRVLTPPIFRPPIFRRWNEFFQRIAERPEWSTAAALSKAVACAAAIARFGVAAAEGAASLVKGGPGAPPPLLLSTGETVFVHRGIVLRRVGGSTGVTDARAAVRGAAVALDAAGVLYREWTLGAGPPDERVAQGRRRPPPLCTPLCALVDAFGTQVLA